MQLLPRQGGERVRESHLLFQIKVREETQLFLFCILFSLFFWHILLRVRESLLIFQRIS